jgi:hypothetical protein
MAASRVPGSQCVTRNACADRTGLHRHAGPLPPVGVAPAGTPHFHRRRGSGRPRAGGTPAPLELRFVSLSLVVLAPSARDYNADLAVANAVFAACHVQFYVEDYTFVGEAVASGFIGTDARIDDTTRYDSESSRLARGATAGCHGRVKVFYVRTIIGPSAFGIGRTYDRTQACGLGERVYVADNARLDSLAHELGHVLLNDRDAANCHSDDNDNLMAPMATRTGRRLTPEQCQRMYQGAVLPQP